MTARTRYWLGLALLVAASVAAVAAGMGLGIREVGFPELLRWLNGGSLPDEQRIILADIRLPRVVLAYLIGMALASAGLALQGLFRNPLVDPYVIGVSAGGALGAGVALALHLEATALGFYAVPLVAFAGGAGAVWLALGLSRAQGRVRVERLLLAGVALSSLLAALLSLLLVVRGEGLTNVVYWIMGGIAGRGWSHVALLAPYVAVGMLLLAWNIHRLNVLQLGEEAAHHLGVPVEQVKLLTLVTATLLTAAAVSVGGIIGFVGLMVPHMGRMLTGSHDLRALWPVSALLGGTVLVVADTAARVALPPQEIPVGIITALLGAPFFLLLLRRDDAMVTWRKQERVGILGRT